MTKKFSGRLQPPPPPPNPYAREIDPDVANYQREICVGHPTIKTGQYYYEIEALKGWGVNTVYWECFPWGEDTILLAIAGQVSKDTAGPAPASDAAARFRMGLWEKHDHDKIEAEVDKKDVKYIYQVTGSDAGGTGYMVVKYKDEKYSLRWYVSAKDEPTSLIASVSDTVTLSAMQSLSATSENGYWWQAMDDEHEDCSGQPRPAEADADVG